MTAWHAPGIDDLEPAPIEPCPCGHGDIAAAVQRQGPLISRAIQGDAEALAELYEDHVDDVYRYLLAWTWDLTAARELTEQVLRGAVTWLPAIAEGQGDLGAWLIALARDAVGQHLGADWMGQVQAEGPPGDEFDAVEQLDAAQREVVVLRLLLGHSIEHTAQLAGYDPGVVAQLQYAGCATIWQLLTRAPLDPPPHGREDLRPHWFEQLLMGAIMEPDADPALGDVLAVAVALRQGAAEQVPLPDDVFVAWLRNRLLHPVEGGPDEAPPVAMSRFGRAFAMMRYQFVRHPWAVTIVAAAAIGLIIGFQMAGGSPTQRAACSGQACADTTVTTAAAETTLPSLPLVAGPDQKTTSSTLAALALTSTSTSSRPPTTARSAPSSLTTAPPTTVPTTTQTTRATTTTTRRATTTTKATPTTGATTTSTTTSTTLAGGVVALGG